MAVVNRNQGTPVYLAPPSTLTNNNASAPATNTNTQSSLSTSDNLSMSVVPSNYPQVTNSIPASIFPQSGTPVVQNQTQQPATLPPASTGIPATGTPTGQTALKPISMSEAQWAVKFEEKVQKNGYQPTPQESAKYQDIVARFKANPKVDSSILDILASQSSSLGAQVASMRYGEKVSQSLKGFKSGSSAVSGLDEGVSGGFGASLKGLGSSLLKGTGLSAVVAGGFSLITNGIQVLQGKKTWADVGGTVAADTANGAVSGLTGTLAAGGATLLAGALGATGIISTLIIGAGAMGGAWLGDKLFRGSGMYDKLKDKVTNMFPQAQTYQPQYNNSIPK